MRKALILHAWYATPENHWYQELKTELEKLNFQVTIPELQDKDKPTLKDWTKCALKHFELDKETIIISHSLGSALALNLVEGSKVRIDKLITVAGWDYWDLTPEHESFLNKRFDYEKIIKNSGGRYVIHSDCDPYVTEFIAREYSTRIGADFILVPGAKHFAKEDGITPISQILEILHND